MRKEPARLRVRNTQTQSNRFSLPKKNKNLPCDMQYINCLGTLSPAARHAAKDAEKLIAIVSKIDFLGFRFVQMSFFEFS